MRMSNFVLLCAVALSVAAPVSAGPLTVMTYNSKHGGAPSSPDCPNCSASGQRQVIASQSPRPDVIIFQEMPAGSVASYVSGLNTLYGYPSNAGFVKVFQDGCKPGQWSNGACSVPDGQGVAILVGPNRRIVDSDVRMIPADDHYSSARGWVRVAIDVDGTTVQIFGVHFVPNYMSTSYQSSRAQNVTDLMSWAAPYSQYPTLLGGDFNAVPTESEMSSTTTGLSSQYTDAWTVAPDPNNTTSGKTHTATSPGTRIDDFWARSDGKAPIATGTVVVVPVATTQSDHRPVVATYMIGGGGGCTNCTTYPSDDFDANHLDTTKWSNTMFSGSSTLDTNVHLTETNHQLQIGPVLDTTGQHYNGVTAIGSVDFHDSYAYVDLVPPVADQYEHLCDVHRRVGREQLLPAVRLGRHSVRTTEVQRHESHARHPDAVTILAWPRSSASGTTTATWSSTLRRRRAAAPVTWQNAYTETWNSLVNLSTMQFEIKTGTSGSGGSGTAVWDNFRVDPSTAETILLADDFTGDGPNPPSPDSSKWTSNFLISSTAYTAYTVAQNSDRLEIGPLGTGVANSQYNGITSAVAYDFTDVYAVRQSLGPATQWHGRSNDADTAQGRVELVSCLVPRRNDELVDHVPEEGRRHEGRYRRRIDRSGRLSLRSPAA